MDTQNFTKLLKFLNRLKGTDKNKIDEISLLAVYFKDKDIYCQRVSESIMEKISLAENDMKLSYFYVMDSIVKNICEPYNKYFSESLVSTFVSAFNACKEAKTREKFYKLRLTWKDKQFPYEITHELDRKVKAIDPNWPLIPKRPIETDSNNNQIRKRKSDQSPLSEETKPKLVKTDEPKMEKLEEKEIVKVEEEKQSNNSWNSDDIVSKLSNLTDISNLKNILATINALPNGNHTDQKPEPIVEVVPKLQPTSPIEEYSSVNQDNFQTFANPSSIMHNSVILPFNTGLPPSMPDNKYQNNRGEKTPRDYPFVWMNPINGFPQMPKIGTDPRLLYKCPYFDASRPIHIDNQEYLVLLDRIQPCVLIDGLLHAVRFVCRYINIYIDGVNYEFSTNEINTVVIRSQLVALCIGGPFHEIVIDGWPYHVPMTGQPCKIMMGGVQVEFAFNVRKAFRSKIMNQIPVFVTNWVEAEFFGHPKTLRSPPMNPLENVQLNDALSRRYRLEILNGVVNNPVVPYAAPNQVYATGVPVTNSYQNDRNGRFTPTHVLTPPHLMTTVPLVTRSMNITPPPTQVLMTSLASVVPIVSAPMDIGNFIQKLIPNTLAPLAVDLTNYQADIFRRFNSEACRELYSDTQCDECGMRFKSQDCPEFTNHLNYHFYKNSINLQSHLRNRGYSKGANSWAVDKQHPEDQDEDEQRDNEKRPVNKVPKFDEWDRNKCSVCNETFDEEYDEDNEIYVLLNAVAVNGLVYHTNCVSDIGKSFQIEEPSQKCDLTPVEDSPLMILERMLKGEFKF